LAAQKGIVVCNSAGNDGNKTWHYIGVPADATGIVTVGAADATGNPSVFTSYGPSSDNRQKPEISAMGTATAYINTSGNVQTGNGTSYSSPLMAGMFACFLQYAKKNIPNFTVATLIQSAIRSANLYNSPNYLLGYGIPNFQTACAFLPANVELLKSDNNEVNLFYSRASKLLIMNMNTDANYSIKLYNISGRLVYSTLQSGRQFTIPTGLFNDGVYTVVINSNTLQKTIKLILN
jgi:hypothetical protein